MPSCLHPARLPWTRSAPGEAASLFLEPPAARVQGGRAEISGRVLPGTRVAVNRTPAEVDDEGRFKAVVNLEWGNNPVYVSATRDGERETRLLWVKRYAAGPGEPAGKGGVRFRLLEQERRERLGEEPLAATPAGVFLVVHLAVENRGSAPVRMREAEFALEDGKGNRYDLSPDGAFALGWDTGEGYLADRDVPPGTEVRGWLVFDVDPEATGLTLHAHGPGGVWYARISLDETAATTGD